MRHPRTFGAAVACAALLTACSGGTRTPGEKTGNATGNNPLLNSDNRPEPLIARVNIGNPINGEIGGSEPDAAGDQRILARGHHPGSEGEKPAEVAPSGLLA